MISAKVMVVEDERVVAMHLKQQLSRLGYEVAAMATRGEQALAHIEKHRPDVVLMDIHIEGDMDGIETARRIPTDCPTAVIYLTAYSEEATLDRARATKPYGYLLKPFSERELHAALQMVMERRRNDLYAIDAASELKGLVEKRTVELATVSQDLLRETSERQAAEQAFGQAQKMEAMGQLTGGVAHDFNNLMQVVVGNLGMLTREPLTDTPKTQRLLAGALAGAKKAASLTQRLLAFARRQPLQPKPTQVNDLLTELKDLLSRALGESIELEIKLHDDLWPVNIDANQLENVLLNLVLNSRDAMPSGGRVTIETASTSLDHAQLGPGGHVAPGDYILICVTDNGTGMDSKTLTHAFEPFFTTKEVGEGSGLGLSQVYGFLKQSGGHIALQSEVDQGTTAKIFLPRFRDAVPAHASGAAFQPAAPARACTETILVVEDDPDVRVFTVEVLRDLGYCVIEAGDGPEALKLLATEPARVDLLFTDIVLPAGMNGAILATHAVARFPHLKVLFTTGYSRNAIVHGGKVDVGVELITKPFSFDELASKVRSVLTRTEFAAAH